MDQQQFRMSGDSFVIKKPLAIVLSLITLVVPEDTYTDTEEPPRFMPLSERLAKLPERG